MKARTKQSRELRVYAETMYVFAANAILKMRFSNKN
jgi:hypothetical protein